MTQPNFCQNCGAQLVPNARFCEKCGFAVGTSSAVPTTLPEDSSSVHVTPVHADTPQRAGNPRWMIYAGILLGSLVVLGILIIAFGLLNSQKPPSAPYAVVPPLPSATNLPVPTLAFAQNALPTSAAILSLAPTPAASPAPPVSTTNPLPPSPTWTPIPTGTVEAFPKPQPTLPNGMLFQDDFASFEVVQQNGWAVGDEEKWNHAWAPNQYILTSKTKGYLALDYPMPVFDDAGVQIEAQLASGNYAQYGIALRANDAEGNLNGYLYGITTDGSFYLAQVIDGAWIQPLLVPYTTSSDIKTGNDKNRLSALVEGDTIRLYINGTLMRIVTDPSISGKGHAGVFVYSGNHDDAQASFSRIAVLDPGKAKSVWAPPGMLTTAQPEATTIALQPTLPPPTATRLLPTATRRPPTRQPSPTKALPENTTFADGFAGNYAGWDEGTDAVAQKYFENGQYHIRVTAANVNVLVHPGLALQAADFDLQARVSALEGPMENAAGLAFRQQNPGSYYIFRVSPNGGFAFARYRDGQYERITADEWIYTSAIRGGYAANALRVSARGDSFTLYINDIEVGTFRDGAYPGGSVGIAASVWENTGSHFAFDDFQLSQNGAGQTAPPASQAQPPNTISVFFTVQNGNPTGYVIDKQGVRHDGSVQAAISGIPVAVGDRIVLQTYAPRFSFMFDCSTEPQAFSPCDFTADTPANLPREIQVNKNGAPGFINLSRADNWGDLRPGHAPQRYPADPVLRIVLGN